MLIGGSGITNGPISSRNPLSTDLSSCFGLDPVNGDNLPAVRMPEHSAFVLGHEEFGLSFNKEDLSGLKSLTVPQFGKVQNLNVSIAASIVMYEYVRQHNPNFKGLIAPVF